MNNVHYAFNKEQFKNLLERITTNAVRYLSSRYPEANLQIDRTNWPELIKKSQTS